MRQFDGIELVAFDMYGTLVRNDQSSWEDSVTALAREQGLAIAGSELYREWSLREREFRRGRTNMSDPEASPPFQSYEQAWGRAFAATFADLGIEGDAEAAAKVCVDAHSLREPFSDTAQALAALTRQIRIGVLSNADDRFLHGTIANQGWAFELVVSSEGARAYKPDPRIFRTFCRQAGVAPANVLYVGDSAYDDVHGAKLAGMRVAHIVRDQQTPGRTPPPEGTELLAPDLVIASLAELLPALTPARLASGRQGDER